MNPAAVNGDGTVVVGHAHDGVDFRAVRWTSAGGAQDLGAPPGAVHSYANGVSGDGLVVVGDEHGGPNGGGAFLWTSAAGMQDIGVLPGQTGAVAADVNSDGTVVVGNSYKWSSSTGYTFLDAFRWTASGGMQDFGVLAGDQFSYATAVNGDGSIVAGTSYRVSSGHVARAFLWTQQLGMVELSAHLAALGLDLTGWDLGEVRAISADGSAMVGLGLWNGQPAGWIVNGLCDASWSNYGTGFPGTLGIPALTAQGDPVIGTTLSVDVGNSATIVALLVGTQSTSIPMKKGGDLLVVPLLTLVLPLPVGGMTIDEDIDDDVALCGLEYFEQTLIVDFGAAKKQSASAGLKLVLGF